MRLEINYEDLPDDALDKSLPANARDMGLIPGLGRFHMLQSNQARVPQLLSLCSRACVLQLLKPLCSSAHTPQEEKPQQ